MLNLDFTEEQDMLREMVRGLCAQYASNEEVRALEDDPVGYSAGAVVASSRSSTCSGLLLPAEYGGRGMSMLDGVILYEELGRPSPRPRTWSAACHVRRGARCARAPTSSAASGCPGSPPARSS